MIPCGSLTATISSGNSQSDVIDLQGYKYFALYIPVWDAANITLLSSPTANGSFQPVYDDTGAEVTITAAANRIISIDAAALKIAPLQYIKLRSGTASTPVPQTAERKINILYKE